MFVYDMSQTISFMFRGICHFSPDDIYVSYLWSIEGIDAFTRLSSH